MLEKSFVEERKNPKASLKELIKKKDYKGLSEHLEKGIEDYLNGMCSSDTWISFPSFTSIHTKMLDSFLNKIQKRLMLPVSAPGRKWNDMSRKNPKLCMYMHLDLKISVIWMVT